MGEEAAGLFFDVLNKKRFIKVPPVKLVLEPELMIRESSIKLKS
jgi:DNA-binding LacI/PurR family transcriptional regulator